MKSQTQQSSPTAAEALATFAASTEFDDLSPEVVGTVKRTVADGIACAVAGSALQHSQAIQRYAAAMEPGPASVLGGSARLSVEQAALVNASAMHGIESDDYHTGALAHPGCTSVPVSLAVAEEQGLGGGNLIASAAVGMEVTLRLGRALMPSMIRDRGFHETGVTGVFGAAAAAAHLDRLHPLTAAHGLAIAASQAAGTTEFTHSGGEVKRLHAGIAAAAGVRSARLAAAGLTGPLTVIEGPRGVLQAYAEQFDRAPLFADLGQWWDLLDTSVKQHACCGALLGPVSHLEAFMAEGVAAADIADIEVLLDSTSSRHVGAVGPKPRDLIGAQMSAHYSLAMTLAGRGNSVGSYLRAVEGGLADPDVLRLAELVRVEGDPEADRARPARMLSTVAVTTRDGHRHVRSGVAPGTPEVPLTDAELAGKFHTLVDPVLGASIAARIEEQVADLEHVDVRELLKLTRLR